MKKIFLAAVCTACIAFAVVAQKKSPPAPPPPPPAPPTVTVKHNAPVAEHDKEIEAFLKRNPSVQKAAWKEGHILTLTMKDKTIKTYNLEIEKMKKAFAEEFGEAPVPPPPLPPAPPVE